MQNEVWLRMGSFILVLALMMIWEAMLPNRTSPVASSKRWLSNFFLVFCEVVFNSYTFRAKFFKIKIFKN